MPVREKLFEEFPPVTSEEWMEKIVADLKGADFHRKLVWKTIEGFEVMPFYRREDIQGYPHLAAGPGEFPWVRGTNTEGSGWLVRQDIEVDNFKEANRKALLLLDKGVESLGFRLKDPEAVTPENVRLLLEGISPEKAEVNFICEGRAKEIVEIVSGLLRERNIPAENLRGAFEADPVGRLMVNGKLCTSVKESFDYLSELFRLATNLKAFRLIQVHASHFANAGVDTVTELAYGLAIGNEYMAALTERGISPARAASGIRFCFGLGSNYFFEIAKLRAARMLWAAVVRAYVPENEDATKMRIHCVTGRWNKTIYDPYVNMLRTQTEAMAAVLGGTDSLTVEPFDIIFRKPDEFSERIARNQQLLLKEEAYFSKVSDPAGGAYYIETLTHLIAENAWKLFVDTERNGGFLKSLREGIIQKRVREVAGRRLKDVAAGKEVFIGTTHYPAFDEKAPDDLDIGKIYSRKSVGEGFEVEPLPTGRGTEEIEKLRLIAERASYRPVVALLPVGNLAMAMARSQFSGNFFACGGYRVIDNPLFRNIDEGVKAVMKDGADIIVLCSSDEEYAELAPELKEKTGDRFILVVAGNPPCMEELKQKGIKYFISIRSGLVETLSMFHRITGLIND